MFCIALSPIFLQLLFLGGLYLVILLYDHTLNKSGSQEYELKDGVIGLAASLSLCAIL